MTYHENIPVVLVLHMSNRKLSDQDQDGHLTFQEFTVAMHLIFLTKLGYLLPVELDPASVLPPMVSKAEEGGAEGIRELSSVDMSPTLCNLTLHLLPYTPHLLPVL